MGLKTAARGRPELLDGDIGPGEAVFGELGKNVSANGFDSVSRAEVTRDEIRRQGAPVSRGPGDGIDSPGHGIPGETEDARTPGAKDAQVLEAFVEDAKTLHFTGGRGAVLEFVGCNHQEAIAARIEVEGDVRILRAGSGLAIGRMAGNE